MKINILLSTYNGEKYLSEQLDSILTQTYQDWRLLIRDDGSEDGTRLLIKKYQQKDKRIEFINENSSENIGFISSFFRLLKFSEADYYFFCDQDDIWLPNKIELTINRAFNDNQNEPMLYFTSLTVVRSDLQEIGKREIDSKRLKLTDELLGNQVTGGVMMVNRRLASLWESMDSCVISHDWYLALLASATGQIVYIEQSTELYRQHENNVIGEQITHSVNDNLKSLKNNGISNVLSKQWEYIKKTQLQASKLFQIEEIDKNKIQIIQDFVELSDQSILRRTMAMLKHRYRRNSKKDTFLLSLLLLTNFGRGRD
ncbi:putative protein [Lactococcus lactis]|uniref:glycosyltransferase family 2 protein n=1 Tax=Lactococcus lactis TaxID=1358 RepID=UPI0038513A08